MKVIENKDQPKPITIEFEAEEAAILLAIFKSNTMVAGKMSGFPSTITRELTLKPGYKELSQKYNPTYSTGSLVLYLT